MQASMDIARGRNVDQTPPRRQWLNSKSPGSSEKLSKAEGTLAQPLKISDSELGQLASLLTTDLCQRKECAFHCVQTPIKTNEELCWMPALGGDPGYGLVLTRAHNPSFADFFRLTASCKEHSEWIEACRLLTQQTFGSRALVAEHGGAADDDKGCSCVSWWFRSGDSFCLLFEHILSCSRHLVIAMCRKLCLVLFALR